MASNARNDPRCCALDLVNVSDVISHETLFNCCARTCRAKRGAAEKRPPSLNNSLLLSRPYKMHVPSSTNLDSNLGRRERRRNKSACACRTSCQSWWGSGRGAPPAFLRRRYTACCGRPNFLSSVLLAGRLVAANAREKILGCECERRPTKKRRTDGRWLPNVSRPAWRICRYGVAHGVQILHVLRRRRRGEGRHTIIRIPQCDVRNFPQPFENCLALAGPIGSVLGWENELPFPIMQFACQGFAFEELLHRYDIQAEVPF